ncbi:AAEL017228-PA [Aedes aegypti]|uniref:AAEL017228-PA n=1 Tax=Aedes aegypti TaxID=7159 RepID=J9HJA6_AEDAE|nr:AAEL017228-PA [Aedes aegypti]
MATNLIEITVVGIFTELDFGCGCSTEFGDTRTDGWLY